MGGRDSHDGSMRLRRGRIGWCLALAALLPATGFAQTAAPAAGSPDTLINGKPAARAGDQPRPQPGAAPVAPETSPNVMINGKPAVTGGCAGGVPITSPNVFINGKPAVIGCSKP
jgi:uncharacterized Zn-binding protein involved in type VI secretion